MCEPSTPSDYERSSRAQSNIAILCVVAALLATLSYTSVLTPPKIFSDCTDLCDRSVLRLSVALQTSNLHSIWKYGTSNTELRASFRNKTILNITKEVDSNLRYVMNEQDSARYIPNAVSAAQQLFLVCNGVALLASLSCLIIACYQIIHAETADEYEAAERVCLGLIGLASGCVFAATVAAHFQVYYLDQHVSAGLFCFVAFSGVFMALTLIVIIRTPVRIAGRPYVCFRAVSNIASQAPPVALPPIPNGGTVRAMQSDHATQPVNAAQPRNAVPLAEGALAALPTRHSGGV